MKTKLTILKLSSVLWFISINACAQIENKSSITEVHSHPRILLLEGEEVSLKQTIASDIIWKKTHQHILDECNKLAVKPPV
jgi:hypothetical protein